MIPKLIQEKLKTGMRVNFILRTGKEVKGEILRIEPTRVVLRNEQWEKKRIAVSMQAMAAWEILPEEKEQLYEDLIQLPERKSSQVDNLKYDTVVETEEFEWKKALSPTPKNSQGPSPPKSPAKKFPKQKKQEFSSSGVVLGVTITVVILLLLLVLGKFF